MKKFLRFPVYALMVTFLFACLPLAYVNYLASKTTQEVSALRKLEEQGFLGGVFYEHQYRPDVVSEYDPSAEPLSSLATRLWGKRAFARVHALDLKGDFEAVQPLGIHAFERLRRLSLASTSLKDLSGLEQNSELAKLTIGGATFLKSEDIDELLGRNPLLQELDICCCNVKRLEITNASRLESLQLSEIEKLQVLKCHDSCPRLDWISIDYCPVITAVEISNAPRLDTIRVDTCPELTAFVLQGVPDLLEIQVDQFIIKLDDKGNFTIPNTD